MIDKERINPELLATLEHGKEHRKRFVIVFYEARFDYFTLALTNQGRYHFDDKSKALEMAAMFKGTYQGWNDMRVIEADCYDHGDCCATVFSHEYIEKHEVKS